MSYGTPPPPEAPVPGAAGGEHPQGVVILVLGILSLVLCGIFTGIPAVIMGRKALAESKTANYSNEGMVKIGYILGIISCALFALAIVGWIIFGLILAAA